MLEVHINICPSGFVDKCSTAIISTLSSTDCKGGNIETNETNPRDDFKEAPVDFDNVCMYMNLFSSLQFLDGMSTH